MDYLINYEYENYSTHKTYYNVYLYNLVFSKDVGFETS